VINLYVENGKG